MSNEMPIRSFLNFYDIVVIVCIIILGMLIIVQTQQMQDEISSLQVGDLLVHEKFIVDEVRKSIGASEIDRTKYGWNAVFDYTNILYSSPNSLGYFLWLINSTTINEYSTGLFGNWLSDNNTKSVAYELWICADYATYATVYHGTAGFRNITEIILIYRFLATYTWNQNHWQIESRYEMNNMSLAFKPCYSLSLDLGLFDTILFGPKPP